MSLQYPVAVSQRGRPQKRKQRLFESVNKLTPFEKLTLPLRDILRLRWLVGPEIANDAVRRGYKAQTGDIVYSQATLSLCCDERAQLHELQQYFEADAWQTAIAAVDAFDITAAVCASCSRRSGSGNSASVKWIQCDGCLSWQHLTCAGYTRKPRGNWFCESCNN